MPAIKLQSKLLLLFGTVLITAFALIEIIGYQQTRERLLAELRNYAFEIRGVMMATRTVYQHQFVDSGLPLDDNTVGFLPAHAMSRISDEFHKWSSSGLSFNNVSDRPRNPNNQADAVELEAIDYFRANPEEIERMVLFKNDQNRPYYHLSSPIWTEQFCLKCHGDPEDAPATIRETYDKAFNYEIGELRGLMSIKMPAGFIEEEVLAQRLNEVGARLFAFAIAFFFGAWLLRSVIVRRLMLIQSAAGELARGDYSARVPVSGSDELCSLAEAFNNMAEQRQQAELSHREAEQQVRDLLDSTFEAIYGLDTRGRCTIVNPACLRLFGYQKAEDMIGQAMHPLIHHTKADGSCHTPEDCLIARTWRDGRAVQSVEDVFWRANGESFPVEYSSYPIRRDGRLVGAVVTFLDISERLKSEESLRRAQKMEAIGQLTGGIAHDFNNLLGIILGNLELLEHHIEDNDQVRKRVETIEKSAQRAADLTKQLLRFSRRESTNVAVVDLNQVIRGMEDLIARSVTPAVQVKLELAEQLWPAEIDRGDLQDAMMNLILNARDAMSGGGELTLATVNSTIETAVEESGHVITPGQYIELNVRDNGQGIPSGLLERIFEPFFTTKVEGKGTGLGLSMVYGFVQRSHGYISAYSEPDKGTRIRILLPRSQSELQCVQAPAAGVKNGEITTHGHETILIVDDETDLLEIASQYLESCGYRTLLAENGEQALKQLELHPEIDLLFSDVVMPNGMNGYDLAGRAKARQSRLRVLLASGFTQASAAGHSRAAYEHMLSKPYSKAELIKWVREILDG